MRDSTPLPPVDDSLAVMEGMKYFSAIDAVKSFHQIPLPTKEDRKSTAFGTHMENFEYRVLPMGLSISTAVYQRYMDTIFCGLKSQNKVLTYVDDISVLGSTFDKHLENLDGVWGVLEDWDIRLKLSKCKFAFSQLKYLGHIVGRDGVRVDPEKTDKLANYPIPRTVKEVQSFLGFTGYFWKFVKSYSEIARPLTDLTKGTQTTGSKSPNITERWNANGDCQASFNALIQALQSPPVLPFLDFNEPFEVHTDASDYALAWVLLSYRETRMKMSESFNILARNSMTVIKIGMLGKRS